MTAIEGRLKDDDGETEEVAEIVRRMSATPGLSSRGTAESLNSFQDAEELERWEAPEEIRQNYRYYLSGYDHKNRPIWIAEVGKVQWNMRKLVAEGPETMKLFTKYIRQGTYRAVKSVQEISTSENPVTDLIIIVDMTSLSVIQFTHIPTIAYVFQLAKEHKVVVTKHIHVGLIINTGMAGFTAISLVKPIIGKIAEKLEVFGSDRNKWEPQVLKFCPRDQIPELYGGNIQDFEPVKKFF